MIFVDTCPNCGHIKVKEVEYLGQDPFFRCEKCGEEFDFKEMGSCPVDNLSEENRNAIVEYLMAENQDADARFTSFGSS